MAIQSMHHVGIVVNDLKAATDFFIELGLELVGEDVVEGDLADRIIALKGTRSQIAFLQTADGHGRIELSKFHTPPSPNGDGNAPSNAPGIRHISFGVTDIDALVAGLRERGYGLVGELENYENMYRLCYVRGPEGIIVELAERIS